MPINHIGSKWICKVKHKVDVIIERYKAKLVAKEYNKIEGLDFFDILSTMEKVTNIRTLLATTAIHTWLLHQLGVNNVFLHYELQQNVHMPSLKVFLVPCLTKV